MLTYKTAPVSYMSPLGYSYGNDCLKLELSLINYEMFWTCSIRFTEQNHAWSVQFCL